MSSREGFIDRTVRAKHPNKHRRDWKHELPARLVDTWRTSSPPVEARPGVLQHMCTAVTGEELRARLTGGRGTRDISSRVA